MYDYEKLLDDVKAYSEKGVEVFSIGSSVQGREIYCFAVGSGTRPIISTAAIHARENASAYVVLAQLRFALEVGAKGRQCFIPLVNPDGAEIIKDPSRRLWKANARGVDLNVNFDARWGTGAQNVTTPGSENYIGPYPFSEPESRALRDFTESAQARATLSYHTMGRELYWYFYQTGEQYERDYSLARSIDTYLGGIYRLDDSALGSAGGYKDWCIETLKIPAFTIELGYGTHPLAEGDLSVDIEVNRGLVNYLAGLLE